MNESAFPQHKYSIENDLLTKAVIKNSEYLGGLTKREYFAAMAMQGIFSSGGHYDGSDDPARYARISLMFADAMITELSKDTKE